MAIPFFRHRRIAMHRLLGFTLAALLFSIAGVPAQAGLLVLDLQGVTSTSSSLAGNSIAPGTSFEIKATFDTTTGAPEGPGEFVYQTTSIIAIVGGTSYMVTDPANDAVGLVDPTNVVFPGLYFAFLFGDNGEFAPSYLTATPPLAADSPTPTVFSDYLGSLETSVGLSTNAGTLVLDYDETVGVSAAILGTVPEPSSIVMTSVGGLMALGIWRRRRAKVTA
jgi:hypothetical protein